ncbi:MAG: hypothetical protein ACI9CF_000155 [Candidatus Omnitrophota bacterium]|jgi:hypothetical protein
MRRLYGSGYPTPLHEFTEKEVLYTYGAYYEASWMSLKGCLNPAVLDAPVCRYPIKSLEAEEV